MHIMLPAIPVNENDRTDFISYQAQEEKNMSKHQYRSELGIISDILSVTMDCGRNGMIVSRISRRANLSHTAVVEKCQKLTDLGLMESISNERNRIFVITEKGIQFFQYLQKFIENMQEIKIRF